MLKNLKWLVFGSIGYRLKGFLIGVAVGFGLATLAPSAADSLKGYLSWLIPSAHAVPYYDWDSSAILDDTNSMQLTSALTNHYAGGRLTAFSDGVLSSLQIRAGRFDNDAGVGPFTLQIYEAQPEGSDWEPGDLIGESASYDFYALPDYTNNAWVQANCVTENLTTINANCPLINFPVTPESPGSLDFLTGDHFYYFFSHPTSDSDTGIRFPRISDQYTDVYSFGSYFHAHMENCTLPSGTCSSFSSGNTTGHLIRSIFDNGNPYNPGVFSIANGPHVSFDSTIYSLGYFCGSSGDIWGYDPATSSDYSFIDSCTAGESGYFNVALSGDVTEWLFQLRIDFLPIGESSATIIHDPNSVWFTGEPDGLGSLDPSLTLCNPILYSEYITPVSEYDEDEVITQEFINWGQGVVYSAYSYIVSQLTRLPVIGDAVIVNCLIYQGFISNLTTDPVMTLTANFDGFLDFDDTMEITLDYSAAIEGLQAGVEENPRYEDFRVTMTMLVIFIIMWKVWIGLANIHPTPVIDQLDPRRDNDDI